MKRDRSGDVRCAVTRDQVTREVGRVLPLPVQGLTQTSTATQPYRVRHCLHLMGHSAL